MNLTFVTIHTGRSSRAVPLAAAMLASAAKAALENGLSVRLADFYPDDTAEHCADALLEDNPDCAAFPVYVWNRDLVMSIAFLLKQRKPEIVLFAGGPEVSANPEQFKDGNGFDFAVPGEGESLFVDALLLLGEGAGHSTIRKALMLPSPPDLTGLPSPYLDGTLDVAKLPGVLWELSRGCPFSCHFCYESRGRHGVRTFPLLRIRHELELFVRSGVQEIFVLDPTFNCDKKRAAELLTLMHNTASGIRYFIEVRSEFLDRKTARLFSQISCSLQIGLQSAHEAVLENVGRTINREQFARNVLLLHEEGVTYGFDLIYGLPGDSLQGFLESIDFAISMRPNHLDIFPLEVLPGTRLAETAAGFGLEFERNVPYTVTSSPTWSGTDLEEASRITSAVDIFYNRGSAVPWFDIVLSNLGMNASDFFTAFASWLSGREAGPDAEILQKEFLTALFEAKNLPDSAAVCRDIIALFASDAEEAGDREGHEYSFDPDALFEHLESGVTDFEELAFFVPQKG